ncbi:hypothetical protein [Streptomyces sp. NRRL F-5135]|uniref:hypothetical protein n=1 Tax=Streptomyces sp. NRRL F-5135 TaxID=1463858 RepID=UPI00131B6072|nr:hypothetical protein [Streptomyces sp. NRRL F-5135]
MTPIRAGRWQAEYHQRAIHLTREPKANPNCPDCHGRGYITAYGGGNWENCHCLAWLRTWRLRLWPRRNPEKEYPF